MAHEPSQQHYESPASERSLLAQIRLGAGLVVAFLLLLFMAQNLQRVEINFLWFTWNTRLVFALVVAAAFGGISTVVAGTLMRRGERQHQQQVERR